MSKDANWFLHIRCVFLFDAEEFVYIYSLTCSFFFVNDITVITTIKDASATSIYINKDWILIYKKQEGIMMLSW